MLVGVVILALAACGGDDRDLGGVSETDTAAVEERERRLGFIGELRDCSFYGTDVLGDAWDCRCVLDPDSPSAFGVEPGSYRRFVRLDESSRGIIAALRQPGVPRIHSGRDAVVSLTPGAQARARARARRSRLPSRTMNARCPPSCLPRHENTRGLAGRFESRRAQIAPRRPAEMVESAVFRANCVPCLRGWDATSMARAKDRRAPRPCVRRALVRSLLCGRPAGRAARA